MSKKAKLTFYPRLAKSVASEPAELRHKSTRYSGNQQSLRVSSSYVSSKVAPIDEAFPELFDSQLEEIMETHKSDDDEGLDPAYLEHLEEISTDPKPRKRTAGDDPMKHWLPERDRFLEELLTLEGRGHQVLEHCPECQTKGDPFHRIREWNGRFYIKASLKSLGLRIQLGHPRGNLCSNPQVSPGDDFVVIDTSGIHEIGLDFCGCVQLLRQRLYPATTTNPKSAVTFRALETYEMLSYSSKLSCFEFYQSLSRLSDNTGTQMVKDRYQGFLLMVRQWRYLRMLKRAGRGHDPDGAVAGTKEGECAILCPACPLPGINLPDGWEHAPSDKQHLYALFLGIDANFRLKRKYVSDDARDPDLGDGFAYFVREKPYKEHLEQFSDYVEPKSTCSRHDAVNLSNTKPGVSHAATGVGTIECARHNLKRPSAVGDLQFGERYINMDYLFYASLFRLKLRSIFVSYDIACQWSIHLRERMLQLDPEFLIFNSQVFTRFVVPKFHLPAHVARCRSNFSLNYTVGAGRTDGEAPERGWAEVNPLASSTKEMGPGSRRDCLDAHFGDYNWRKVVGMGPTLLRKARAAASEMADHTIIHIEFSAALPKDSVLKWTAEVEAWEKDPTERNPYDNHVELPTQAAVRRRMAEEDAVQIASGKDVALDVNMTPSVLISAGLDLEAEQRSIKAESSKLWDHSQDRQKTRLQLRNNALSRKLIAWTERQQLYMPAVVALRRIDSITADSKKTPPPVHEYPLWLPSSIQNKVPFDSHLADIEWELRVAQAHEALEDLRRHLQIRSYLFKFKDQNVRGQHANTRARHAIDNIQSKITASAEEYRAAHRAIVSLGTLLQKVGWKQEFQVLEQADIRELSEREEGISVGRSRASWIWLVTRNASTMGENDDAFQDALRLEWCKSRARAMRFAEEVDLLDEEMQRVLRFLEWKKNLWLSKADLWSKHPVAPTPRGEGLIAYAHRQAGLQVALASHFRRLWLPIPSLVAEAHQRILHSRQLV
ncbi:hypothetical protein H0H92_001861 [Tricholoma furcatifolium]|nr:hypothetical protein H0H92_001861 [Tricholoma furcatifolium]